MFVGFLGLMDFPVEGEDRRTSLAEVGYVSFVEAFQSYGLRFLIPRIIYQLLCEIQLTLSQKGKLFSSSWLGFLEFHGVEAFNVSGPLCVKVLRDFEVVFRLCRLIEATEMEAFTILKSLSIEALNNDQG